MKNVWPRHLVTSLSNFTWWEKLRWRKWIHCIRDHQQREFLSSQMSETWETLYFVTIMSLNISDIQQWLSKTSESPDLVASTLCWRKSDSLNDILQARCFTMMLTLDFAAAASSCPSTSQPSCFLWRHIIDTDDVTLLTTPGHILSSPLTTLNTSNTPHLTVISQPWTWDWEHGSKEEATLILATSNTFTPNTCDTQPTISRPRPFAGNNLNKNIFLIFYAITRMSRYILRKNLTKLYVIWPVVSVKYWRDTNI